MTNRSGAHDSGQNGASSNKQIIELEGKVIEALPNAVFRVEIDMPGKSEGPGNEVLAHLAGRLRLHRIRILPGDRVRVELTPYDLKRGRITRRL